VKITIAQGAFLPVPALRGGAVEKVWFALGQEFARRGHCVHHFSREFPGLPREQVIGGVHHRRVPGFDTPRSLAVLKALDLVYSIRLLRHLPPADILVTNTFWLPILARSAWRGKLYIHVARYPRGQMRFYRHAARLQTVSRAIKSTIIREVPESAEKVCCIPYPLSDAPPFAETAGEVPREQHLLYVGRVHPEKGVHLLVEAMGRLQRVLGEEWKLVVVGPWATTAGGGGDGYAQELRRIAQSAGAQVQFVGPVFDPHRLAKSYRTASLFVYPSLAEKGETFGVAPLEAMSHGCPAVVSDLACFRDFVSDGVNGFVFNHRASSPGAALYDKLRELFLNPARIDAARTPAVSTAQNYSIERIAGLFLDDFASLLEPARLAAGVFSVA
jgi:glycosyltransferase involved in cell wall biosynthesis